MFLKLLESEKTFIQSVIEKQMVWQAVVSGILGYIALPLIHLISLILTNKIDSSVVSVKLTLYPVISIAAFFGSTFVVYIIGRIFKSKGTFREYLIANGFNGVYMIISSLLLIPILLLSNYIAVHNATGAGGVIALFIILIFAVIFTIKYGIFAISYIFRFTGLESLLIWCVVFVPVFIGIFYSMK